MTQLVHDGLISLQGLTPSPALATASARPLCPHLTTALGKASQPSPQPPPTRCLLVQLLGHDSVLPSAVKVTQIRPRNIWEREEQAA